MQFDLATIRVAIPDHVLSRIVDGSTVVLDIETGRSYSFDEVGTGVWQALTECDTARAAVIRLTSEYDAPPDTIERDLVALLEQLVSNNLIHLETVQKRD